MLSVIKHLPIITHTQSLTHALRTIFDMLSVMRTRSVGPRW